MVVILFRTRLSEQAGEDYTRAAEAMTAHAKTFPGYIAQKFYTSADGERLTVVWWEDMATLEAWRTDVKHRAMQQMGRDRWYAYYKLEVAEVVRASTFERPPAAAGAGV